MLVRILFVHLSWKRSVSFEVQNGGRSSYAITRDALTCLLGRGESRCSTCNDKCTDSRPPLLATRLVFEAGSTHIGKGLKFIQLIESMIGHARAH